MVDDQLLAVHGWAVSRSGITRVEAVVDGEPMGELALALPSPHVARAYPALPPSASAGFGGTIALPDSAPGRHELSLRITAGNGTRLVIEREFEVVARTP